MNRHPHLSRRIHQEHRDINTDNPKLGIGLTLHVTDNVESFRSRLRDFNQKRIIRPANLPTLNPPTHSHE